ncbi:glycosyltransferase [Gorillibacterium sp. CAU 1737]|uniref:glycosyltransferase n=1 Tax=Gorillibacterium sp. CAU 1737 TaxID=3140362 RepID=UPI003260A0AF
MRVTVVIPTYNGSDLLKQTLLCLAHQDPDSPDFEVIICDDGSQDNTKQTVCSFEDRLDLRYCYQPDLGFRAGAARNMGISLAKYEVCVLLDTGVLVGADFIRSVSQFHTRYRGSVCLGIVHGISQADKHPQLVRLLRPMAESDHPERCLTNRMLSVYPDARQKMLYDKYANDLNRIHAPWLYYWTCMTSLETSLFEEVGLFDESFVGWGHEDLELGYRLWKAGIPFRSDSKVRALHLPHEQYTDKNRESYENILRMYTLHQEFPVEVWYTLWTVSMPYNSSDTIDHFVKVAPSVPRDYPNLEYVTDQLPQGKRLLIGGFSPELAARVKADEVFTIETERPSRLAEQLPSGKVFNRIGLAALMQEKTYSTVIITDIWKAYPSELLRLLLNEALRIAEDVYLIDQPDVVLESGILRGSSRLPDEFSMGPVDQTAEYALYQVSKVPLLNQV